MLIIGTTGLGALASLVAVVAGGSYAILLGTAFVVGGIASPLYSLLVAYANDYLEIEQMAAASGGLLFINGFGAMSGPIIVGWAMSNYGIDWFFISMMILLSLICLYGLYRMTQRAHTVVADERAPYLPISSRTGIVATEMALEAADEAHLDALEEDEETLGTHAFDDECDDGDGGTKAAAEPR